MKCLGFQKEAAAKLAKDDGALILGRGLDLHKIIILLVNEIWKKTLSKRIPLIFLLNTSPEESEVLQKRVVYEKQQIRQDYDFKCSNNDEPSMVAEGDAKANKKRGETNYTGIIFEYEVQKQGKKTLNIVKNAVESNKKENYEDLMPLLHIINSNISQNERCELYTNGGFFSISTKIIIMDFLTGKLDPEAVDGIIINHCHRVIRKWNEVFAIRLYRQKNRHGFLKGLSDRPEYIGDVFNKFESMMKNLIVKNAYYYPRIHYLVKKNLEGEEMSDTDKFNNYSFSSFSTSALGLMEEAKEIVKGEKIESASKKEKEYLVEQNDEKIKAKVHEKIKVKDEENPLEEIEILHLNEEKTKKQEKYFVSFTSPQPEVNEIVVELKKHTKDIQRLIIRLLQNGLTELKKLKTIFDFELEDERKFWLYGLEGFERKARGHGFLKKLNENWRKISSKNRKLIQDMCTLRKLLELLFKIDCVSFYSYLQNIKDAQILDEIWFCTIEAEFLQKIAQNRVFTITKTGFEKSKQGERLSLRLEVNEKCETLYKIIFNKNFVPSEILKKFEMIYFSKSSNSNLCDVHELRKSKRKEKDVKIVKRCKIFKEKLPCISSPIIYSSSLTKDDLEEKSFLLTSQYKTTHNEAHSYETSSENEEEEEKEHEGKEKENIPEYRVLIFIDDNISKNQIENILMYGCRLPLLSSFNSYVFQKVNKVKSSTCSFSSLSSSSNLSSSFFSNKSIIRAFERYVAELEEKRRNEVSQDEEEKILKKLKLDISEEDFQKIIEKKTKNRLYKTKIKVSCIEMAVGAVELLLRMYRPHAIFVLSPKLFLIRAIEVYCAELLMHVKTKQNEKRKPKNILAQDKNEKESKNYLKEEQGVKHNSFLSSNMHCDKNIYDNCVYKNNDLLLFSKDIKVYLLVYKECIEYYLFVETLNQENTVWDCILKQKDKMLILLDESLMYKNILDSSFSFKFSTNSSALKYGSHVAGCNLNMKNNACNRRNNTLLSSVSTVIVDMREFGCSLPYHIHLEKLNILPLTITVGDYILSRDICIERKSIPDLISSLNSGRLFQQVKCMCKYYLLPTLLIDLDGSKGLYTFQNFNNTNDFDNYNALSKLILLSIHFPTLRLIWSTSPAFSALLFVALKYGREEPDEYRVLRIGNEYENEEESKETKEMEDFEVEKNEKGNFNSISSNSSSSLTLCNASPPTKLNTVDVNKGISNMVYKKVETSTNSPAIEILRRLPGINFNNINLIASKYYNLVALVNASEEELASNIGSQNAKLLYTFLNTELTFDKR